MSPTLLFDWLEALGKLGSPNKKNLEHAEKLLTSLKEDLLKISESSEVLSPESAPNNEELGRAIQASVNQLLSSVDDVTISDVRVVCGCHVLAIVLEIQIILKNLSSGIEGVNHEEAQRKITEKPPASPNLISIQQTKILEDALRLVIYTVVLGCLNQEASQYVKLMLARNQFALGPNLVSVSPSCRHCLLTSTMKILLGLIEHPSLGTPLRGILFPEVLSALLELCFAPGKVKDHPEDTTFFREQLEKVLSVKDANQTLQHLLMLKGITKNGGWLQKVCGSFIIRRYMMQPNGVAAVIGAGLIICEGQDWKRFEAVAALVAHAKFPNMDLFYSTIGPQVSDLMLKSDLKPEILHVVMLVVSELAQRSATLTALHVTSALMLPLLDTTTHHSQSPNSNCSLTLCITQINKLFVEIGVPSTSLMSLLRPVIDPLMAVAAFPASHLRSMSQHCVIRYLSQQSNEDAIDILLHICKVHLLSTMPTINPNVTLTLAEDGGVRTSVCESSCRKTMLENDENLTKTVVLILETLKNPVIVRMFYEKLVLYIDFTVLNEKELSPTMLMTDEDIQGQQIEAVRRVHISCSLLSNLADSEQLTNDLFQNLSAAVPVVDTLLKTSCQRCDNEALDQTKLSFLLNVVMMVSCYVNEQMMSKKMSSEDWKGLKLLLPTLEEIRENISDEAVLLFVEQLRNIVLTHGLIGAIPGEKGESTKSAKKLQQHSERKSSQKEKFVSELGERDDNDPSITELPSKSVGGHSNLPSQASYNGKMKDKPLKASEYENNTIHEKIIDSEGKKSSYSEAMEDLLSPRLPIRGHGLLSLSKLIEERDSETLSHKEQLLALFHHSLKDEDSYLYLTAIRGLTALCDAYPEKVAETLTREFSIGNRSAEDRAKLAEALARASRRLGPVLPHHSSHFINSLLSGVRDNEAIVRASSLSSLGEVCKTLRFSLGPILYEIFGVLQAVVDGDKAVEVRRAAILVVTLILQGLGRDAFSVLKDVIRDLYRVLRLVHVRDADDVVRLHCQLAMEEIDTITKEFLLPKLNLTKRIYVADLPPNQF